MPSLWAAGLLLRRVRTEPGLMVLLFILIAATSFLFAAAPRLFNRVSDDALRYAARTAPAVQRDVVLALASDIGAGMEGGVSVVRATGDQLEHKLPPSIASLISGRTMVITAARFFVTYLPTYETHLTLRYQDGLPDATRLVSGHWPVDRGVPLQRPEEEGDAGLGNGQQGGPVVLEAALSTAEAGVLGVTLGQRLPVTADGTDPLIRGTGFQTVPILIQVVGLYEPRDSTSEYWSGDASLLQLTLEGQPDPTIAYATAYVPAEMYATLQGSGMPFRYEWRFRIDPERLDAGQLGTIQDELRHIGFVTGSSELAQRGIVVFRSGLRVILDQFASQRSLSESILSIAAIGPLGLAGGALGMAAILLIIRRRAMLALARGRGASGSLVLGTELWEAILIAGGASLAGLLVAVTLIPARDSPLSVALAVAVGGAAVLLLVGATWPVARRPLGQLERDDPPVLHVSPRRLVIELTIVGIAASGAILLRQRGLTIGSTGAATRVDPLLAAVPVLSGLAAGIVAMRLYPLPIRALGWLAARRRDLVPVLALRTIGRHPAAVNLPLLVLMLTAAFGAFASVIVSSLDRGQAVASYEQVGADYRIEKVGIGSLVGLNPTTVPGVEAAAPGVVERLTPLITVTGQRSSILLEAVDPVAYQQVKAGTPVDPPWPAAFLAGGASVNPGTAENPIPAILSSELPPGSANLAPGATFRMVVRGQEMTFRLAERRDSFAGIDASASFAVVPYAPLRAAFKGALMNPTVLWVRAPAEAAKPLAAEASRVAGSAHVTSRHEIYAALHDAPLVAAIAATYGIALVVAAVYLALTIIGALALSAARRTQDLAYLRTLGVTGGQALALTVAENAPPVVLALIPGVALGIGVALLVQPGLGLAVFVGSGDVPLFVDWPMLALMVLALIGVVAIAVTAGTWLSRRARLVDALRMGED